MPSAHADPPSGPLLRGGSGGAKDGLCPPGNVAVAALVGPVLHVSILVAPLAALGLARPALGDPAVRLFLLLAVVFSLADLPTLFHEPPSADRIPSAEDRRARRWALIAGLLLLATFWVGLLERSLAGGREAAWPQASGALLMLAGISVRAAAVLTLGRAFKTEWRVAPDQPLVEHHIYAWVRHPSETGNLAVILGACLLLGSHLAPALLLVFAPLTVLRIRQEELRLAEVHGPRFLRYATRVRRFLPWVY
jgi:protein-S-isoprenylcysteine O-methyltransferase Ste14